jgi:rhodanese-related sulfurtransferase
MPTTSPATSPSPVTATAPADPGAATAHFEALLSLETDCWDVHQSLATGQPDFVLLHVNGSRRSYDAGHIGGATFLHHSTIDAAALDGYPAATIFVVYCAGPHCNGADRAAARIARLGRPVKKMIGGVEGWRDEGFQLATTERPASGSGVEVAG